MAIELPDLKKYAGLFRKGLIIELAPNIAKGVLVEILKAKGVSREKAIDWVQSNTSLWKTLDPEEQDILRDLAARAGSVDWLDANWVIEAIKGDFLVVASLFLGWRKANTWLKRQVEIIRKEVEE